MKHLFYLLLLVVILSEVRSNSVNRTWFAEEERIVGGQVATDGQFPYHVRLTLYGGLLSEYVIVGWCGGVIIDSKWILTAAHCVIRDFILLPFLVVAVYVEAGSATAHQPRQSTSLTLFDFHVHPNYVSATRESDIALLHTEAFNFNTRYVQPIALPTYSTDVDQYAGKTATASGFGFTTNTLFGMPPDKLSWINLKVITKADCEAQYEDPIPGSSLCAEDPTPPKGSVCNYDSGGPLALTEAGQTTVIGITSYGSITRGCDGTAQGFQNVAQFVPWILETMATNPIK